MNYNSADEEEAAEPPLTTVLIIGRSSTGKTNLVRALLKEYEQFDKVTYVLNDRTQDWPYKHVFWHQVGELSHCQLVVEDVISANSKQFKALQELCNFRAHHKRVNPIFVISHSLHRQNLSGLLPFFTHVSVTAFVGNLSSFKTLLTYFGFEPEEKQRYKELLLENKKPFSHLVLNVQKMSIELKSVEYVPPAGAADKTVSGVSLLPPGATRPRKGTAKTEFFEGQMVTKKDAVALAAASRFLGNKLVRNSEKALALFQLIYSQLPKKNIDANNLTIKLNKANGRGYTCISLIDYVSTLSNNNLTPTAEVAKLHKYCITKRRIVLPNVYLVNKKFW